MKRKRHLFLTISSIALVLGLIIFFSTLSSEKNYSEYNYTPTMDDYQGSVFSMAVRSESSDANDLGKNILTIENLQEAIHISFAQQGKDREFSLQILYDYKPVQFSIDLDEQYSEVYVFSLANNTGREFDIYLSPESNYDGSTHKLMISFISGYSTYAKDMNKPTSEYGLTEIYDFNITEVDQGKSNYDKTDANSFADADDYVDVLYDGLLISPLEVTLNSDGSVGLPDTCYTTRTGEEIVLECLVTNMDPSADNALVLLTIDRIPVKVNGQDFLLLNLTENSAAINEIKINAPLDAGTHDVIGYVVYNPFIESENLVYKYPQTSVRFSLAVN